MTVYVATAYSLVTSIQAYFAHQFNYLIKKQAAQQTADLAVLELCAAVLDPKLNSTRLGRD